jgi:hypothetical protein
MRRQFSSDILCCLHPVQQHVHADQVVGGLKMVEITVSLDLTLMPDQMRSIRSSCFLS